MRTIQCSALWIQLPWPPRFLNSTSSTCCAVFGASILCSQLSTGRKLSSCTAHSPLPFSRRSLFGLPVVRYLFFSYFFLLSSILKLWFHIFYQFFEGQDGKSGLLAFSCLNVEVFNNEQLLMNGNSSKFSVSVAKDGAGSFHLHLMS